MRGNCCEQLLGAVQRTAQQRMIEGHTLVDLSGGVIDVLNQGLQQSLILLGEEIVKDLESRCVRPAGGPGESPVSVFSLEACDLDCGIEPVPEFVAFQASMLSFQQCEQLAILLQLIAECFNYIVEGCVHRSMTVREAAS